MGPYQRTPKEVVRAIRYSGLGVRSVGPVGDFLDDRPFRFIKVKLSRNCFIASCGDPEPNRTHHEE